MGRGIWEEYFLKAQKATPQSHFKGVAMEKLIKWRRRWLVLAPVFLSLCGIMIYANQGAQAFWVGIGTAFGAMLFGAGLCGSLVGIFLTSLLMRCKQNWVCHQPKGGA